MRLTLTSLFSFLVCAPIAYADNELKFPIIDDHVPKIPGSTFEMQTIDKITPTLQRHMPSKETLEALAYVRGIDRKIKSNWIPIRSEDFRELKISFKLDKDGNASDIKVIKSTGDEKMDNSGLEAVRKSSPFGKLPENVIMPESHHVVFAFDNDSPEATSEKKENAN